MPESFWLCLQAMYASVDGTRADEAEALDRLENDFREFDDNKRSVASEQIDVVIAQLSRLSMRLKDATR